MPATDAGAVPMDAFSSRLMDGIEASTVAVTDDQVRNARHAYYANISYFDSKIGEIVRTIEEIGHLDNTIFIITADHGDMLGERGLWYKMNFFEHSARVPLIMTGPSIANGAVNSACSLIDLLPTMIDIALGDDEDSRPELGQPIDGRSLWAMAHGGDEDDGEAIGEYCAEMTASPVFMIRRGDFKYIHCDDDPLQLHNLANDPAELVNLAEDPAHETLAARYALEVAERWDSAAIKTDVIAKQHQRSAVLRLCRTVRGPTGISTHRATHRRNMCATIWTGLCRQRGRVSRRCKTDILSCSKRKYPFSGPGETLSYDDICGHVTSHLPVAGFCGNGLIIGASW